MIPRLPDGFSHPMRIGEGAFASVYRVKQKAVERWVALKVIPENEKVKRTVLLKEAQTQAKLRAACVPAIYDAFEWRRSVCIVMEWIRGISLNELLSIPLSAENRLAIGGAFVKALSEIHSKGFAHRDLKPANVIISPDRGLFLVDFGFSKYIADMQISSLNTVKGTPAYMAPELWSSGSEADLMRADIYAAGKILFQILSDTPYRDITATLYHDNPACRPASGTELLELWEKKGLIISDVTDWKRIAGNITSERLSDNLFLAAQQLLFADRAEEAYWLLVESVEENSENKKALDLLTGFHNRTRERHSAITYLIIGILFLTGICAAFFAGLQNRKIVVSDKIPKPAYRRILSIGKSDDYVPASAFSLRMDSIRTDKLGGILRLRNINRNTTVEIDGRKISSDSALSFGVGLIYGAHTITVLDSAGYIIGKETIRLLPFQTKCIDAVKHSSIYGR